MGDSKPSGECAANHLRKIADNIEKIQPIDRIPIQFDFSEFKHSSDASLKEKITEKVDPNFQSIYSFHLSNLDLADEFYEAFKNTRENKIDGRAYARLNKETDEKKFGNCFYVGSSRNIIVRLEQHLGLRAPKTYSLQMKHWANGLNGGFEICVHKFELDSEKLKLLPYLEDRLAWELNPMFGRRGSL